MNDQEAELRQRLHASGVSVRRDRDNIVLVLRNDILFKLNSNDPNPEAIRTISSAAEALHHYNMLSDVNGYTDTTGSYGYNMELSRERAKNAATILTDNGVTPARIVPRGFGETHLTVPTGGDVNEPRNRRVKIHIESHMTES